MQYTIGFGGFGLGLVEKLTHGIECKVFGRKVQMFA
jgi:hypothetical protein